MVVLFRWRQRDTQRYSTARLPAFVDMTNEVYAVSAYILNLNGIIAEDELLDAQSLPKVRMPNRDGFIPFPRDPQ